MCVQKLLARKHNLFMNKKYEFFSLGVQVQLQ